jgi:hypothetical protein
VKSQKDQCVKLDEWKSTKKSTNTNPISSVTAAITPATDTDTAKMTAITATPILDASPPKPAPTPNTDTMTAAADSDIDRDIDRKTSRVNSQDYRKTLARRTSATDNAVETFVEFKRGSTVLHTYPPITWLDPEQAYAVFPQYVSIHHPFYLSEKRLHASDDNKSLPSKNGLNGYEVLGFLHQSEKLFVDVKDVTKRCARLTQLFSPESESTEWDVFG